MEKNKLTNSEWEVYECLWEEAPLTLAQLRKRYVQRTGLAVSTAETTVLRMEKKGLLRVEQGERAKLFYPPFCAGTGRPEGDPLLPQPGLRRKPPVPDERHGGRRGVQRQRDRPALRHAPQGEGEAGWLSGSSARRS